MKAFVITLSVLCTIGAGINLSTQKWTEFFTNAAIAAWGLWLVLA